MSQVETQLRKCLGCESDLSHRHKLVQFCAKQCQNLYAARYAGERTHAPRPCTVCGKVIEKPRRYNNTICSHECRLQQKRNWATYWRAENPEKCKRYEKKYTSSLAGIERRMVTHYGGYEGQYRDMYDAQGGQCRICKGHAPLEGEGRLCVDHDHSCCPGSGRTCGKCTSGLLCHRCNKGIGAFSDRVDWLLSAAEYVAETRQSVTAL